MLIDLPTAKLHLRVDGSDEDVILALYIGAAEQSAMEFLNRKVYADQDALMAAIAAAPTALTAATTTYDAAILAAGLMTNAIEQDAAYVAAETAYRAAQTLACETFAGMVVNAAIKAAILLTLGHLHANRESVNVGNISSEIPRGVDVLLYPYRVGMGV